MCIAIEDISVVKFSGWEKEQQEGRIGPVRENGVSASRVSSVKNNLLTN